MVLYDVAQLLLVDALLHLSRRQAEGFLGNVDPSHHHYHFARHFLGMQFYPDWNAGPRCTRLRRHLIGSNQVDSLHQVAAHL